MKALTIQQPYASAIAIGKKKIEFRTWETSYRGKLAIHVSSSISKQNKEECSEEPYSTWLRPIMEKYGALPVGQVIAVVNLVDVFQNTWRNLPRYIKIQKDIIIPDPREFCWVLENPQILEYPITVKGRLGLWELPELDE